ncbi:hypothetical protein FMEAI12_6500040 [Parafrankia sp. Ea1.12]|nr:hypothetical protein FMEAI12_6500040 [Parafrankia sp. Ea1.12]
MHPKISCTVQLCVSRTSTRCPCTTGGFLVTPRAEGLLSPLSAELFMLFAHIWYWPIALTPGQWAQRCRSRARLPMSRVEQPPPGSTCYVLGGFT